MRELMRSMAKARMRDAGYYKLFKETKGKKKGRSVFSRNWRKFWAKPANAKESNGFGLSKKRDEYWSRDLNARPKMFQTYGQGRKVRMTNYG